TSIGRHLNNPTGSPPGPLFPGLNFDFPTPFSQKFASDWGAGVAVDALGNAYITGATASSTDFPTFNAFRAYGGGANDAFVMKLDPFGVPVYSSFVGGGGDDGGRAIAVDPTGAIYITGYTNSTDYPVVNAVKVFNSLGVKIYDGSAKSGAAATADAFMTKIDP